MGKVCEEHGTIENTFAEVLFLTLSMVPGKKTKPKPTTTKNPNKKTKNPMKSEVILQFLAVLGVNKIY